jgi:hypothetical protein
MVIHRGVSYGLELFRLNCDEGFAYIVHLDGDVYYLSDGFPWWLRSPGRFDTAAFVYMGVAIYVDGGVLYRKKSLERLCSDAKDFSFGVI